MGLLDRQALLTREGLNSDFAITATRHQDIIKLSSFKALFYLLNPTKPISAVPHSQMAAGMGPTLKLAYFLKPNSSSPNGLAISPEETLRFETAGSAVGT
jgi:hypothetical protein